MSVVSILNVNITNPLLFQSIPTLKTFFAKSKLRITWQKRFLHTMNLWSNPYEPSVTEYIAIPPAPTFDLSAELTFALTVVTIFDSMLNFL